MMGMQVKRPRIKKTELLAWENMIILRMRLKPNSKRDLTIILDLDPDSVLTGKSDQTVKARTAWFSRPLARRLADLREGNEKYLFGR